MRSILVPIDDSNSSHAALEYALETFGDDEITLLHVIDPNDPVYGEVSVAGYSEEWFEMAKRENVEDLFEDARELASGENVSTAVEVGSPAREIVEYAQTHDVDHIVIGSHGRSGVTRLLLGSVSEMVVRRAPVPVTVVH
ncbi:MAG: universal stress protein [Halodesulfurarchaeum sp.]